MRGQDDLEDIAACSRSRLCDSQHPCRARISCRDATTLSPHAGGSHKSTRCDTSRTAYHLGNARNGNTRATTCGGWLISQNANRRRSLAMPNRHQGRHRPCRTSGQHLNGSILMTAHIETSRDSNFHYTVLACHYSPPSSYP